MLGQDVGEKILWKKVFPIPLSKKLFNIYSAVWGALLPPQARDDVARCFLARRAYRARRASISHFCISRLPKTNISRRAMRGISSPSSLRWRSWIKTTDKAMSTNRAVILERQRRIWARKQRIVTHIFDYCSCHSERLGFPKWCSHRLRVRDAFSAGAGNLRRRHTC